PLDAAELAAPAPDEQILAVHEALNEFAGTDPQAATLVKLRFFRGMAMTEAAEALGMSVRNAHDLSTYARSRLGRHSAAVSVEPDIRYGPQVILKIFAEFRQELRTDR